ncbi:MAG: prolipoprotein diacylglyceryl transferase [Tepidisphaeraceae bacterium]
MTFPVIFHPFGLSIPAHAVFDALAYTLGGILFRLELRRRRDSMPAMRIEQTLWLVAGVILGAAIGAKLLAWIEDAPLYLTHLNRPEAWIGGKTIAGGILGGWIGVEITKKLLGVTSSTGDAFVLPLTVGIAVGRIGCFLTGLPDHTYGIETALAWGIDFGDGVSRHPTQLYESLFVLIAGTLFLTALPTRLRLRGGMCFRLFVLAYCLFRVAIEFIKPTYKPIGVSAIQTACAMGAIVCLWQLARSKDKSLT